uniref:Tryptophan synthase beta chain-like PALP domain-containing protein n=1 Tax=Romanomermis culicivorax TaxID=13658 RepID=A0A915JF82_ROMCU
MIVTTIHFGILYIFGNILFYSALVDGILLVDDLEIVEAIKFLYFQMATVVEPAGAAPLAALMFGKVPLQDLEGKNIVIVISGRNVTAEDLERILNK